jgi:GNAT superfamily N-acetyltransferase
MAVADLSEINEQRRAIRHLLRSDDPSDALASYYALWHDPRRTRLIVHYGPERAAAQGFVVLAQTGADLFRPLVTLRADSERVAARLLQNALEASRPYQLVVPIQFASVVREHLTLTQPRLHHVYQLRPSLFQPVVNVLVQRATGPDGVPRFKIESQGRLMALSGTNWRSPAFAEVFLYVHPRAEGRGWGKSVLSACTADLLEQRLRPLYLAESDNHTVVAIAEALGYVDTGAREFSGEGRRK